MRVVLMVAGERLGTTEWDKLPAVGQVGLFTSEDGRFSSVRSVDHIEDGPDGGEDRPPGWCTTDICVQPLT
jgi:hypothetical protein